MRILSTGLLPLDALIPPPGSDVSKRKRLPNTPAHVSVTCFFFASHQEQGIMIFRFDCLIFSRRS